MLLRLKVERANLVFNSARVYLNVEKVNQFIDIIMLRRFPTFNVLNYHMLIKLQIIIEKSLLNITEEQFYDLSDSIIVLLTDTLIDLDDGFSNLALLTW